MAITEQTTYEQVVAEHRWHVPERFNIAAAVCDVHPRDKLAMVHEHHSGAVREVTWGELQDLANRAANALAALGVQRGDRVAVWVARPLPRRRRCSSPSGRSGQSCSRCRCSTATTGFATA